MARRTIGRPGLLLLAAATAARLADNAAAIALVLLIIARTHDPRLAGLVAGAFIVPTLVTGPVLGALPLLAVALGRQASGGGWLLTALSAGGLAGSLLSDWLLAWRAGRAVLLGSLCGFFVFLAAMAVTPSFWAAVAAAAVAGIADGPSLAATLSVRQQTVPPDRYAQATATAASLKTGAYALGAGCVGLFTGTLTPRQLMLGIAAGQLPAVVPLLASRGPVSAIPNEALVPAPDTASP